MMGSRRSFVFGIGLNKTGTSSLHEALTILGYQSLHWGGPPIRELVSRAITEGKPMLHYLDPALEAVSDVALISHNFDLADAQYPGSRFILTVRDLDAWLDSRRRHVEKNQQKKAEGEYHGTFLEVDVAGWKEEYEAHEARVRSYFDSRPNDLLVVDIASGDGWAPLCRFLRHPEPDVPFPSENRFKAWRTPAMRPG
jgi:hypothetical protein